MITSLALALVVSQAAAQPAPPLEADFDAALGALSLSTQTARFDPNLLPFFRQGEFTSTFYTAGSENPWRLPFFVDVYRRELASFGGKPSDALATGGRLLGFGTRRTLIGDPIAAAVEAAKKPDALTRVLERMRGRKLLTKMPSLAGVPPETRQAAALILEVLETAHDFRTMAFSRAGDLAVAYGLLEPAGADDADLLRFNRELALYRALDTRYLAAGAHDLALASQTAETILAPVKPDVAYEARIDTAWGAIELTGGSASTHPDVPSLLIIDTGGDDTYLNCPSNAGASNWASVVIDTDGSDKYLSDAGLASAPISKFAGRKGAANRPGPAGALLGYAILIDSSGNDLYRSHRPALGSGRLGVGILLDKKGDDTYDAYVDGEGFGMFGAGILEDDAGTDAYAGFSQVQGVGQTGGFGYLVDRVGNDAYVSNDETIDFPSPQSAQHNVSMSQGAGNGRRADYLEGQSLAGGVGILYDLAGDDTYASAVFGQGVGYWEGVGMLWDGQGDDRYSGLWYVQGAAAHFAIGYLEDEAGSDRYNAPMNMAQGAGHDFSIGFLLDHAGDDSYKAPNLSLGAGNANGIGIFADLAGNDRYDSSGITLGQAAEAPAASLRSRALCLGVFLDLAGSDAYPATTAFAKNQARVPNIKTQAPTPAESQLGVFWDR